MEKYFTQVCTLLFRLCLMQIFYTHITFEENYNKRIHYSKLARGVALWVH